MFDIVIRGARIYDGTGNPWYWGDVGIANGQIKKVGQIPSKGNITLDRKGFIVCPGFIDIHSHSDLHLLPNPSAINKVMQGVTTEVTGNCGMSLAPVNNSTIDALKTYLRSWGTPISNSWTTLGIFLAELEDKGMITNIAPLVGHGTIRIAVMGFQDREPTTGEMDTMKAYLRKEMEDGIFGMSTGLIYPPGSFSKTDELIELTKVLREYDGLYATHVRNETDNVVDSYREAINIGEINRIKVQMSHHKVCGRANWGAVQTTLQLIEEAREKGIDVTSDQYPYKASSTGLRAFLPPWVHAGGNDLMLKRLSDKSERRIIKEYMEERTGWENGIKAVGSENIVIAKVKTDKNRELEGKSLAEVAEGKGLGTYEATFELLLEEEGDVSIFSFGVCENDLQMVMRHPTTMFGSDGSALSENERGKPHPRNYGTYARILGKYTREENVLNLSEAIRKMTSFPAQKIGLKTRGVLREGNVADITIFDPITIADTSTYQNPSQFPKGIRDVIINGDIVIKNAKYTGKAPGRVLTRN